MTHTTQPEEGMVHVKAWLVADKKFTLPSVGSTLHLKAFAGFIFHIEVGAIDQLAWIEDQGKLMLSIGFWGTKDLVPDSGNLSDPCIRCEAVEFECVEGGIQ